MTDYTKLIERLRKYDRSRDLIWTANIDAADAIEALQGECAEHKENAIRNARQAVAFRAERDALQAKLDAAHAVLDSDDSKIVRNASDGYPEGREPRELALSERVEALCTYATDWKRWCEEVQSKLDELQRQEPVGFVQHLNELNDKWLQKLPIGAPVYAAPKALEPVKFLADATRFKTTMLANGRVLINDLPRELAGRWVAFVAAENDCHLKLAAPKALTEHVSYATTVMALIEDYAKAVHDGDDNSCTVLRRTIKASLEQPPKALEPLTPQRIQELHEQVLREPIRTSGFFESFTRAIEAAHGITKGTPT